MTKDAPLTGVIAKVASNRTVILNRGSEDGVHLGDRFQILSKDGEKILDPQTGEILQEIPYEKSRVEVEELYERASVARTYETRFTGGGLTASASLTELFGPRREVYKTFEAEITPDDTTDRDLTVRVGDPVKRLHGEFS